MTVNWPSGEAAFVTGAASGIGLGIARALVAAGARVALVDLNGDRLNDVATELSGAGGTVVPIELDVGDPDQWQAAADRAEGAIGPISILVNNAGVAAPGSIEQTTFELWRFVQRINVDGPFNGISTFLPRFRSRGGRTHILNTASMAGIVPSWNGPYTTSKFACLGLSLALRKELQGTEIGVSVLCPGSVASRLAASDAENQAKLLDRQINAKKVELSQAWLSHGADPDRVGEQALDAMQRGEFLIITHLEWEPLVKAWHEEIERAHRDFDGRYGPDLLPAQLMGTESAYSRKSGQ